jgi:hypothetical protein
MRPQATCLCILLAVARIAYLAYDRPMIRVVRRFLSIRPRAERHAETNGEGINVEVPSMGVSLNSGSQDEIQFYDARARN